jgi:hypothetical protein
MEEDDVTDPHSANFPETVETELSALRDEAATKLSPELLVMSDYLMRSLDLKFQLHVSGSRRLAEKAIQTAEKAEKTANEAKATAEETKTELQTLQKEVIEQGKKIAQLEANQNSAKVVTEPVRSSIPGLLGKAVTEDSPSERVAKLQSSFLTLVKRKEMTNTFILGRKQGFSSATRSAAKGVMTVFFPTVKCIVTKPENAEFARVLVPDAQDAKLVSEGARSLWLELATQGWWMSDDSPEQLRSLEARARSFIAAARKFKPAYKKKIGFVEIDRGFLVKNGVETIPIFLIPKQAGKNWDALFDLFATMVDTLASNDLLGQYEKMHEKNDYLLQWVETAGLTHLAADVRAIRDAQDTGEG